MKKILCALVTLLLSLSQWTGGLGEAATTPLEYSVAEKLLKQTEAGSGFTGTLTLSLTAQEGHENEAITTVNPLTFDFNYISVREDAANGITAEKRYGLVWKDGETTRLSFAAAMRGGLTHLRSELLGEGWYTLPKERAAVILPQDASAQDAAASATAAPNLIIATLRSVIAQSSLPALIDFALPALWQSQNLKVDELNAALATYTTKIDLWIEAYRQNAVLGKLDDGTATMEVQYEIPPAAIKAQIKQLLMDLLADGPLLSQLQGLLPEAYTPLLLDPRLQTYYFYAIDELPLTDNLTLSRMVSLKGDTLSLHITLPLYDQKAGKVTIAYDRKAGVGKDLPDENVISLESRDLSMRLEYQKYQTMTGVTVYQGVLLREPRGLANYEVNEGGGASVAKTLSAAFTLTHEETGGMDEERYETLTHSYKLSLEPRLTKEDAGGRETPLSEEETAGYYTFPACDLELSVLFKSKPEKNSPTYLDLTATFSSEDIPQMLHLAVTGKTRPKWTPEAINLDSATDLGSMSNGDLSALLAQVSLKAGLSFLPYFTLPVPTEATAPDTDVPETAPTIEVSTPAPTPTPTPRPTPTPALKPTPKPAPDVSLS